MPLSTSSFERAPRGAWGRTFLLAASVFVLFFVGIEFMFRSRGVEPSFQETARLWAHWRTLASNNDPNTVVLLGSSRFQLGLDPLSMEAELPDTEVLQLSIISSSPLPILHHLAEDEDFRGVAVVEIHPGIWYSHREKWFQTVRSYLSFYEGRSWVEVFETPMRMLFQGELVSLRTEFRPTNVLIHFFRERSFPEMNYHHGRRDRFREADYAKVDVEEMLAAKRKDSIKSPRYLSEQELQARMDAINADIDAIEARGGEVIFFHMLTSGENYEREQEAYPREKYWAFVDRELDAPVLHFEDFAVFDTFASPDGSHLDYRDAHNFSKLFAREVLKPQLEQR